jgi:hypothetical protein
LSRLGEIFEKEMGAPVKVETQEQIIDKFSGFRTERERAGYILLGE